MKGNRGNRRAAGAPRRKGRKRRGSGGKEDSKERKREGGEENKGGGRIDNLYRPCGANVFIIFNHELFMRPLLEYLIESFKGKHLKHDTWDMELDT